MTDETRSIAVTLSTNLRDFVERKSAEEGVTVDEFASKALERAIALDHLEEIVARARERTRELGVAKEDVPELVRQYRAEKTPSLR